MRTRTDSIVDARVDDPPDDLAPPLGVGLCRRGPQHGVYRILRGPDPALRAVARVQRGRDRGPGRRPLAARAVLVDPYRRADGPVRDPPGRPRLPMVCCG